MHFVLTCSSCCRRRLRREQKASVVKRDRCTHYFGDFRFIYRPRRWLRPWRKPRHRTQLTSMRFSARGRAPSKSAWTDTSVMCGPSMKPGLIRVCRIKTRLRKLTITKPLGPVLKAEATRSGSRLGHISQADCLSAGPGFSRRGGLIFVNPDVVSQLLRPSPNSFVEHHFRSARHQLRVE
jgi:hypothetical protein